MKRVAPSYLLDHLLLFLLPPRDRETVAGDLSEEFFDSKLPELGPLRARLWYMRQVLSFVPGKAATVLRQGAALQLLCVFTGTCGIWLGAMGLRNRHPVHTEGEIIALTIACQALLTLAALRFRRSRVLRAFAVVGSVGLLGLSSKAVKATLGGGHLEGYVLLIALALIVQAVLTVLILPRAHVLPGKTL